MGRQGSGSQAALREANERRLLAAVRDAGSLTQAGIARATGLSAATVSNIVRTLEAEGVLDVSDTSSSGRKARSVSMARAHGVAIGIDFGQRHLRVAVADLAHDVIAEDWVRLPNDHTAADGLVRADALIEALLTQIGVERSAVVGAGLGLPAPFDHTGGHVGSPSILPGWVGVPAAESFTEKLGFEVRVDNDANLGALAELTYGAARGCADVVYVKIASGIGAGVIIDGRLHRGVGGTAGEIGHMAIDEHGMVCRCGNRGCLETVAGAQVLLDLLKRSHGPDLDVADLLRLAAEGDAGCRRVLTDAAGHIGVAVANLTNLLNPERVVVGGDLAAAGDLIVDPLRAAVDRLAISSAAKQVEVVAGDLGERAEVLGALALALREMAPRTLAFGA